MKGVALVDLVRSQLLPLGWTVPENLAGDNLARLELAQKLADQEYHHPECEAVAALEERRSFCFGHGRITAKAILLVHGFTACPYEMRELGQRLYSSGYNVFGVRLAGHGTAVSDFARTTGSDWEASVRRGLTIAALMGEEVIVIGESMGGALTAILAVEFSEFINRVVLCAPCFRIANRLAWVTTLALIRRLMPTADMGTAPDWMRPYWYSVIPTSAIAELVYVARKARKAASRLNTPILVIQAKDDRMVQYCGAVAFFKGLSCLTEPNKQLRILERGHHNLTVDLNPEKQQVFGWIEEFLGGLA